MTLEPNESTKSWLENRMTTRLVVLGVVLSLILGVFLGVRQQAYIHCVAQVQSQAQHATSARAKLGQEQTDAQTAIITEIAHAHTQAEVTMAFGEFLATQNKINTEKLQHPVPPGPTEVCR